MYKCLVLSVTIMLCGCSSPGRGTSSPDVIRYERKHFLGFGIETGSGPQYACRSAWAVGEALANRYGFDSTYFSVEGNRPSGGGYPYKETILRELKALRRLPRNSCLVVYIAGHGQRRVHSDESPVVRPTYIEPYSDDVKGASSVHGDWRQWVSVEEVLALVQKCPARHKVLILEACYAGRVARAPSIHLINTVHSLLGNLIAPVRAVGELAEGAISGERRDDAYDAAEGNAERKRCTDPVLVRAYRADGLWIISEGERAVDGGLGRYPPLTTVLLEGLEGAAGVRRRAYEHYRGNDLTGPAFSTRDLALFIAMEYERRYENEEPPYCGAPIQTLKHGGPVFVEGHPISSSVEQPLVSEEARVAIVHGNARMRLAGLRDIEDRVFAKQESGEQEEPWFETRNRNHVLRMTTEGFLQALRDSAGKAAPPNRRNKLNREAQQCALKIIDYVLAHGDVNSSDASYVCDLIEAGREPNSAVASEIGQRIDALKTHFRDPHVQARFDACEKGAADTKGASE